MEFYLGSPFVGFSNSRAECRGAGRSYNRDWAVRPPSNQMAEEWRLCYRNEVELKDNAYAGQLYVSEAQ